MVCGFGVPISQIKDLLESHYEISIIKRPCLCNQVCEKASRLLYLQTILFAFLDYVSVDIGSLHFNC